MESLYIPQIFEVSIHLEPADQCAGFRMAILNRLKLLYGDTCYGPGFIRQSSIEILSIGRGVQYGSHLTGKMTFPVSFRALCCIPEPNRIVRACVKSVNKIGIQATAYPLNIIIPREIQLEVAHQSAETLFATVKVGGYIYVKILNYEIRQGRLIVVGLATELSVDPPNSVQLPNDATELPNYVLKLTNDTVPPESNPEFGSVSALNALKEKITPYKQLWTETIRVMLNPYELVDTYRPNPSYHASIVKYLPDDLKNIGVPPSENGVYPVFSRAYFKLWEILSELKVLNQFNNQPIRIANLAEGPGGFIQCLIDARNLQHQTKWTQDVYHGITLRRPADAKRGGFGVTDWDSKPHVKKYFTQLNKVGYSVSLGYGATQDGNLLKTENLVEFAKQAGKCQLVTGDGGIGFEDDDSYAAQELLNVRLFLSEIILALLTQAVGGTFILKIYDLYHDLTVDLMTLVSTYYDQMTVIKPMTSRPANSEKYVVCRGFRGLSAEHESGLVELHRLWMSIESSNDYFNNKEFIHGFAEFIKSPKSGFISGLIEFSEFNLSTQLSKMNEGLSLAMNKLAIDPVTQKTYQSQQIDRAVKWCENYGLASQLPSDQPKSKSKSQASQPTLVPTPKELPMIKIGLKPKPTSIKPIEEQQQKLIEDAKIVEFRTNDRVKHIRNVLPKIANLTSYLDMGCGNAQITVGIAKAFHIPNVYGDDVYPDGQFIQPSSDTPVMYKQVVDSHVDLPDATADFMTCLVVIHHYSDHVKMFAEMKRLLKPGGYLFIREHDVPRDDAKLKAYLDQVHLDFPDHPGGDINYWPQGELRTTLEALGFQHIADSTAKKSKTQIEQHIYHSLFQLQA
jgi:ubiquinone/menaquinone biosynthesis C-methylase UbiE/23S rRNA U2552 (ribose-2'-O)-methylase RlmE/FtsJ/DNA-directed RNA polymerase subunit E'/Rpb7